MKKERIKRKTTTNKKLFRLTLNEIKIK